MTNATDLKVLLELHALLEPFGATVRNEAFLAAVNEYRNRDRPAPHLAVIDKLVGQWGAQASREKSRGRG